MPAAVAVRQISKVFGGVSALKEVSLSIQRGEFFSLLGPSGCGKTTLLRIIGGFETPSAGDVSINGESVLRQPPYQRRTNMIFQHLALFPHLSVSDNIAFGLRMKRLDNSTIERKVAESLTLVRLEDYGGRKIDELSGGQKQRVAMARALVNDPDVLLLDEPLGALDLQLRLQMQEELRRLHKSLNSTFIFVTHDQGEAITMSDRIAVMHAGSILQIGTPAEIYETPTTRFVAEFIGHSNFFEGRVLELQGAYCVLDCQGLQMRGVARAKLAPGQAATAVLRYEKTGIYAPDSNEPATAVSAEVLGKTYMGPMVRIELRLQTDSGPVIRADLPNTEHLKKYTVGDRVAAGWPAESVSVLTA